MNASTYIAIAIVLLSFGLPFFGVSLMFDEISIWGTLMTMGGIILLVTYGKTNIKDSYIDSEIANHINSQNLIQRGLSVLGLNEEDVNQIEPLYFHGYNYNGVNEIVLGKDKLARSSQGIATYLFFTDKEVHAYSYIFSIIQDEYHETTDVYFYTDIVSIATGTGQSNYKSRHGDSKSFQYDCFKLTTSGGTSIETPILNKREIDESLIKVRNLIKGKKQEV